ncbi:MAG: tetratricopeptide repeat protein [Saprospiraceae bacterium]|nr:tetratricopeptide repeat protein [Candidatus Vicinibacter affinis]
MKYWLLFSLTIVLQNLSAQLVDSLSIKQVDSLIKLSRDLTAKRDFDKALEVNADAKKLALDNLGKESAAYGSCCFNQGRVLQYKGDRTEAVKWYLESKAIQEKALGKEHPDYAKSLNNLALLYFDMGQYEKAEPLNLESKAIREKALGKEHPDYAKSLNNLALLYFDMGQYEKAEPLYLESKTIQEKALGKGHPDNAICLNNLASLYFDMGLYEKAEPLYLESKAIREKALGKEHPDYGGSMGDLGNLYSDMGKYEKAEPYYLESKAIREKAQGKEHPDYAICLNNLAILYFDMGIYEKAEPLYLEAKAIREKALGKEHPDYAQSMSNLGNLYSDMGQYEKAEPLILEAKAVQEKALGKEHPDYALNVNYLAGLFENMGQYEKAEPLFLELSTTTKLLTERAMRHLSEKELNDYLNRFSGYQGQILSFSQLTNSKILTPACYDNSLFYKGFLLSASNQVKNLALSDSTTTEKYNLLKSYGRRLATEYSKPINERDSIKVATLEEKANDLEKALTRTVAGYGEAMRQVNWKEVQRNLAAGEAAAEFVHYRFAGKQQSDSTMYAALLLLSGVQQPIFIPLFEEKSLDSLLNYKSDRKADYVNGLYTLADRGAVAIEAPKKSLYEILWQPLEKELTGIKTIYFSPSGLLHRINLDAIPISETETLADKYKLIELNSTRQLVLPTQIKIKNSDAVLYGGIQFEQDSSFKNSEPLLATRTRGELSFNYIDSTLRGGTWNYLAGTEREVNAIEKLILAAGMKVNLKKAIRLQKNPSKNIGANNAGSPRILHIATHGYFFPDPKSIAKTSGLSGEQESVFKISDHPMLRSGLIMAGGNTTWQGKQTLEEREDGILTAYEISQMNLSNTELVVLSACETGLGEIQGNEGVYGLQRAFKIAGAKYLIMSLWQVPDKQTSLLMTTFYKKWLEDKMTIPDAFHAAQKELREIGLDPYQWAGFVLVE